MMKILLILSLVWFPHSGAFGIEGLVPTKSVEPGSQNGVYVLNCGRIQNRSKFLHSRQLLDLFVDLLFRIPQAAGPIIKSNPCLLVVKNGKTLLWDAGIADEVYGMKNGLGQPGSPLHSFFFRYFVDDPLMNSLSQLGISPEDIDYVALSHLHYDHAGNLEKFINAEILIQEDEYQAGMGEDPAGEHRYMVSVYDDILESHSKRIEGDFDVFKDGSVVLKKMPGHTPGHQILVLNLQGKPKVLSGDLFASASSYKKSLIPVFNDDDESTKKFIRAVKEIVNKTHGKIWIQHEASFYQKDPLVKTPYWFPPEFEYIYMGTEYFYKF